VTDVPYVYQLAAEMGEARQVFTGDHDVSIMSTSTLINSKFDSSVN
jgi:hypothetical protein